MFQEVNKRCVREIILHVYKEVVDLQDSKKIIKNNFKKPGRFFQKNENFAFQKAVDDFQKAMDDFKKQSKKLIVVKWSPTYKKS